MMLLLAITSTSWAMKKLNKRWKLLHRTVYAACILAVLHIVILGEGAWLLYAVLLTIGFIVRLPYIRKAVTVFRRNSFNHQPMSA